MVGGDCVRYCRYLITASTRVVSLLNRKYDGAGTPVRMYE